jgi:hypothetical protein
VVELKLTSSSYPFPSQFRTDNRRVRPQVCFTPLSPPLSSFLEPPSLLSSLPLSFSLREYSVYSLADLVAAVACALRFDIDKLVEWFEGQAEYQ